MEFKADQPIYLQIMSLIQNKIVSGELKKATKYQLSVALRLIYRLIQIPYNALYPNWKEKKLCFLNVV